MDNSNPKLGRCNICGEYTELTEDHVPPKSLGNIGKLRFNKALGACKHPKTKSFYSRTSRNGIHFRSLCANCNNTILGGQKDQALKEFYDQVRQKLSSKIYLPRWINIDAEVNRVSRSIIGHFLAAKDYYDDNKLDKDLREYVLCENLKPPTGLHLYYFFYPYRCIVVSRDAVSLAIPNHRTVELPDGIFSCLYIFPIGFLLTNDESNLHLNDLFSYCSEISGERRTILFDISSQYYYHTAIRRHFLWPMNISEDDFGPDAMLTSKAFSAMRVAPIDAE